jgi:predicted tellurium resistance membrane protein TerC
MRQMLHLLPDLASLPLPLGVKFYDSGVWSAAALGSLLTLTLLEVILGIDNVVFIAILTGKLPKEQRPKAQKLGIGLAALLRIVLLCGAFFVVKMDEPKYGIDIGGWFGQGVEQVETPMEAGDEVGEPHDEHDKDEGEHEPFLITVKDLIVLLGGLFLVGKAVYEIHDKLEGNDHAAGTSVAAASFSTIILQILALDLVFSIDSVITAVGIAEYLSIMIVAVMIAVVVMITFAGPISRFVERHPTTKILALSFLILIGVLLIAESFEQKIPKGYIYFSLAFALGIEMLNIQFKKAKNRGKPVTLRQSYVEGKSVDGYGDVAGEAAKG